MCQYNSKDTKNIKFLFATSGCDRRRAFYSKSKAKPFKILDDNPGVLDFFESIGSSLTSCILEKEMRECKVSDVNVAERNTLRLGKIR